MIDVLALVALFVLMIVVPAVLGPFLAWRAWKAGAKKWLAGNHDPD